jgi:glucokinase
MAEVTLTAHIGGTDAAVALGDVVLKLRRALKLLQGKQYSSQIEKFRFYMMVSGEITDFKKPSGCVGLRLMKRDKYVKLDIVVGKEIWRGADQRAIKKRLADFILEAFEMAIAKMKKEKIDVKEDELINDVKNIVLKEFLN